MGTGLSLPPPSAPLSQTPRGWVPSPPLGMRPGPDPSPAGAHQANPGLPLGDNGALDDSQQPLLPQDPGHGDGGAQGLPQLGESPGPHQVQAQGPDAALEAERFIDGEILLQAVVQLRRDREEALTGPKNVFPTEQLPPSP